MSSIAKFTKGQSPYGFQWRSGVLVLVPEEGKIREETFLLFLKLKSMGAVARSLNAAGKLTRRGGQWSDVQVARILNCPSAIGRYELNRSETDNEGKRRATTRDERQSIECEPIVTREIWDQSRAILQQKQLKQQTVEPTDIFSSLVVCGCGQRMRTIVESCKLACTQCSRKILIADLEGIFVEDFATMAAAHPVLSSAISQASPERAQCAELLQLETEHRETNQKRAGVEKMLHERSISAKRFEELHAPLEQQIRDLDATIQRLQKPLAGITAPLPANTAHHWKKAWHTWPAKKRRQSILTFVSTITISEDTIEITYLLSDSPLKDPTKPQQITTPTNQTPTNGPIYIRLPKPGQLCTITGLSRAKLNELILPNERNHFNPPVVSKSLRKPRAKRGVRLVLLESLTRLSQLGS